MRRSKDAVAPRPILRLKGWSDGELPGESRSRRAQAETDGSEAATMDQSIAGTEPPWLRGLAPFAGHPEGNQVRNRLAAEGI